MDESKTESFIFEPEYKSFLEVFPAAVAMVGVQLTGQCLFIAITNKWAHYPLVFEARYGSCTIRIQYQLEEGTV